MFGTSYVKRVICGLKRPVNGLKCDISVCFRFALLSALSTEATGAEGFLQCGRGVGDKQCSHPPSDVKLFNISHCTVPYCILYGTLSSMPENFACEIV